MKKTEIFEAMFFYCTRCGGLNFFRSVFAPISKAAAANMAAEENDEDFEDFIQCAEGIHMQHLPLKHACANCHFENTISNDGAIPALPLDVCGYFICDTCGRDSFVMDAYRPHTKEEAHELTDMIRKDTEDQGEDWTQDDWDCHYNSLLRAKKCAPPNVVECSHCDTQFISEVPEES